MKKLIGLLVFTLVLSINLNAQDTIVVKESGLEKTILCKITKVTSMNIFFTENKIGKSVATKDVVKHSGLKKDIAIQQLKKEKNYWHDETLISKTPLTKEQQTKNKSKGWLIASGTALLASGVCGLLSNNAKKPTTISGANEYAKNQKTFNDLSSSLKAVSGLTLCIGVTIYLK